MSDNKVWFITGASRGFGHLWAEAALGRGDRVAATARDLSTLDDLKDKYGDALLPILLDVTDKTAIDAAVARTHQQFGRLDIVINNAGYGLFGAIEEVSEEQARHQIETNLLGPLWVTKAALPILRAQGSGHIIQVSSIGGVNAFPNLGLYHASKWGLEGFSQSLRAEVEQFGIFVTLIEPRGFATDWAGASAVVADSRPEYEGARVATAERRQNGPPPGDPNASAEALLRIVDAPVPPLRAFFGSDCLGMIKVEYASRIENWEAWDDVAVLAGG